MLSIAPVPDVRTATIAWSEGTPIRFPQVTLSTIVLDERIGIIAFQCEVEAIAVGQGCGPNFIVGAGVVVAVGVGLRDG